MNGREEQTAAQITAEQYGILLKKNQDLEIALKREVELAKEKEQVYKNKEEEVKQLTAAVLFRSAEADKYKQANEQTTAELKKIQETSNEQKIQLEKMGVLKAENSTVKTQLSEQKHEVAKLKSKIHWYSEDQKKLHRQISDLATENENMSGALKAAEEKAAKTPRWKIGLGIGFGLLGALLIVSGIGGALIPAVALSSFIVGTIAVLGSMFYGVYKAIRACCHKPAKETGQSFDVSNPSTSDLESPTFPRSNQALSPLYAATLNSQNFPEFQDESKHEGRKCKTRVINNLQSIPEEPNTFSYPEATNFQRKFK